MNRMPLSLVLTEITAEVRKEEYAKLPAWRRFLSRWTPWFGPDIDFVGVLFQDFIYIAQDGRVWGAPAGFRTDLASIPRALQAVAPKSGAWNKAAVVHDAIYTGHLTGDGEKAREEADAIFLEAMLYCGVDRLTAQTYHEAVRVGGSKAWREISVDRRDRLRYIWSRSKAIIGPKFGPFGP